MALLNKENKESFLERVQVSAAQYDERPNCDQKETGSLL